MSVHNGAAFVGDALAGLRDQTFEDYELIVIDDASTDATPSLLAEAATSDPRIRILTNERHRLLVHSLNRGLAEARGRYIARQDADDISLPHRLELQVEVLEQNPRLVAVSGRFHRLEGGWLHPAENIAVHRGPSELMPWHMTLAYSAQHSISLFRRGVVGAYDESRLHAEDYDFWA
ncbi:MAG: glycosyltransferase family 2 protein, partial [Synechococcaceae cyanobacterium]|nr:glycosyltransferase family 2 protein [Synechococcaceae cyanobacterium]